MHKNVFIIILLVYCLNIQAFGQKEKPNIVFILSDDHRYDFMGFTGAVPGLQTPNMDRLANEGAHMVNAFVSTSLCSPSRASILTGQYAHTHTIVDNSAPLPEGLTFFPQYLQEMDYKTGFFGKWHMGNTDDMPQPGFDHWVSFRGQGVYYNPEFNINGERIQQPEGSYTSDRLTDHALDWLNSLKEDQPFMLYLSHKAVHSEFMPAERHKGMYDTLPIVTPPSMYLTATDSSEFYGDINKSPETHVNFKDIPDWVRAQRYSWHGVDHMYHGQIPFDKFYKRYLETLMALDESIGRVMDWLEEKGLEENTIVIYMGDNGFSFGEHGLIDKRHAYEESMKVPMLVKYPSKVQPGVKVNSMVMNIDIAPTLLEVAGLDQTPEQIQGRSFLPLLEQKEIPWRDRVFYEYYWEMAFPSTPTVFAIRTDQYKYIFNHGVWDINELYDIKNDPYEMNNLIRDPDFKELSKDLRNQVWNWLEGTGGSQIPLKPIRHPKLDHRFKGTF
ncbi:sulfatase [Echinicola jeungdonensis]|uniref:Sulfatase n=1 Tax=Echinicola jeungdonensis TaxID=709343 RepID=A0ABV5J8U9_9BACT|nr:sulfatase [Echinicola jeungdonensis]MDN3670239.1 sulfatase [Echinicola jeungdonensis]